MILPPIRTRTAALLLTLALMGCNAAPSPTASSNSAVQLPANHSENASNSTAAQSPRSRSRRSHAASSTQPGNFDFYLLNLSWSPEFCFTHPSSPECAAHPGFIVHGLWPQNSDGTYPQHCSDAPGPSNPAALINLIPTAGLVEHEWTTHGTCSGLTPGRYFAAVRTAFQQVRIPADFTASTQPRILSPQAILTQFTAANPAFPAASFALSCGNNYLTAIEVCFDKDLHPEACQDVRSCRANAVKIASR